VHAPRAGARARSVVIAAASRWRETRDACLDPARPPADGRPRAQLRALSGPASRRTKREHHVQNRAPLMRPGELSFPRTHPALRPGRRGNDTVLRPRCDLPPFSRGSPPHIRPGPRPPDAGSWRSRCDDPELQPGLQTAPYSAAPPPRMPRIRHTNLAHIANSENLPHAYSRAQARFG